MQTSALRYYLFKRVKQCHNRPVWGKCLVLQSMGMNANCVDAVRALVNRCTPINITAELECLWHVEPLLIMQCVCVCVCAFASIVCVRMMIHALQMRTMHVGAIVHYYMVSCCWCDVCTHFATVVGVNLTQYMYL